MSGGLRLLPSGPFCCAVLWLLAAGWQAAGCWLTVLPVGWQSRAGWFVYWSPAVQGWTIRGVTGGDQGGLVAPRYLSSDWLVC